MESSGCVQCFVRKQTQELFLGKRLRNGDSGAPEKERHLGHEYLSFQMRIFVEDTLLC